MKPLEEKSTRELEIETAYIDRVLYLTGLGIEVPVDPDMAVLMGYSKYTIMPKNHDRKSLFNEDVPAELYRLAAL